MFRAAWLEISGTDSTLNLLSFQLRPLPSSRCKAGARSCLPVEDGGPLRHQPCSLQREGAWCQLCVSLPWACFSEAYWWRFPHPCLVQTQGQELSGVMYWLLCSRDWQLMLGLKHALFFPLPWREWEVVPGCSDDAQCFGNYSHSFLGVWNRDPVNPPPHKPHLSLQHCENVQPKLWSSSPSYCILLSVSIWLLCLRQYQHSRPKMSYLGWGYWLSTIQIEDQMQTFTLGSRHLKSTWVELILFQGKWRLSVFYLPRPSHGLFLFTETGVTQPFIRYYLGRLKCSVPPPSSDTVPCSCWQSHLLIPFINWSSTVWKLVIYIYIFIYIFFCSHCSYWKGAPEPPISVTLLCLAWWQLQIRGGSPKGINNIVQRRKATNLHIIIKQQDVTGSVMFLVLLWVRKMKVMWYQFSLHNKPY